MVGASLRHRGEEVLGQRGGLEAYVAERKTFGIPFLYPWANRLGRRRFTVAGRDVDIDPARTPLRLDGNGLPMHGLLSATPGWKVERHRLVRGGGSLRLRGPPRSHGHVPVRARTDAPREARRRAADDRDDRRSDRRRAGSDRLRVPSVPAAARHRARGLARRDPRRRAPAARRHDAPDRRDGARAGGVRSARSPHVRRRLRRACRPVRARGSRPQDRAGVRERLSRTRRSSRRPTTP